MTRMATNDDSKPVFSRCSPAVRTAIAEYIRRVAEEFGDEVVSITLYGSQARGDAEPESDIDLFIVVRQDSATLERELSDMAWDVECEHGVVFSDLIFSLDRLNRMRSNHFPYYQSVEREGIVLWTSMSETMPASA